MTDRGDDAPSWSLQYGIDPEGWPEPARNATAGLRQGSLVESPPLAYAASAQHPIYAVTKAWAASPRAESGVVNVLSIEGRPPYGLIVTQTCDIVEEGKPKRPWIPIAPVYVLPASAGDRRRILAGRAFDYLVPVTALTSPEGGLWVADLRLLVPVEKGWLVDRKIVDGLTNEDDLRRLAMQVGKRFSRPAYATRVVEYVLRPSYTLWEEIVERYEGKDPIVDVGLELGRSPLDPVNAQLVFLLDGDLPSDLRAHIVDW